MSMIIEILFLIIGVILSATVSLMLIVKCKPRVHIGTPELIKLLNRNCFKIPILNASEKYAVYNLKIEAAVVSGDFTYHLKLDRNQFVILPKKVGNDNRVNKRCFKAYEVDDHLSQMYPDINSVDHLLNILKNSNAYLRVRVHGCHEFSGFGKAFEAKYAINGNNFVSYTE